MKPWIAALAGAFVAASLGPAAAQQKAAPAPTAAEMSPAQLLTLVQTDKKGIVTRNMTLTPSEAEKFWPLYESFQKDLEKVQTKRNRAVIDFVNVGRDVTSANAKRLASQVMAADEEEVKLRKAHFEKMMGVLPADKAARYMQIENKVRAVLSYEAARAIPLAQ